MNNIVKKKNNPSSRKSETSKKKSYPSIARAVIVAGLNNNIISISDFEGSVFVTSSSGKCGFKGTRKATPYAAQLTATDVAKRALDLGIRCVNVIIRGIGSGRDAAVMALFNAGLKISAISIEWKIPHNGCRPKKRRRV